jgi:hypothetical protein
MLRVELATGHSGSEGSYYALDSARIRLRSGAVELTRLPLSARFEGRLDAVDISLVHPYLTPVAALAAVWLDRLSFHGGAIAIGGGVWAIFAARFGGKSSFLADLAGRGVPVVTDDLLVIEGRTAFAGPRSVDLRADSAAELDAGEHIGVVGQRERWRLRLAPVPPEMPLVGCICLEWGDSIEIKRLAPTERPARLARHVSLDVTPPSFPVQLLEVAALPAFVLQRPPDWKAARESATRLLDVLASLSTSDFSQTETGIRVHG